MSEDTVGRWDDDARTIFVRRACVGACPLHGYPDWEPFTCRVPGEEAVCGHPPWPEDHVPMDCPLMAGPITVRLED